MESSLEGFFGFFVVLGLLLCPLVLLLLVSILIATLMALYTSLRDWRKPATRIDRQDLREPPTQIDRQPPTQIHPRNTLVGLPAELRLIIYEFALQDTIDSLVFTPPPRTYEDYKKACGELTALPFLGALALNHTSRLIREESLDTFSSLLDAHYQAIKTRCTDLLATQRRRVAETNVSEVPKEKIGQILDDIDRSEQTMSNTLLRLSAVNLMSKRTSFGIISDARRSIAS
jgi:hypothetical protein